MRRFAWLCTVVAALASPGCAGQQLPPVGQPLPAGNIVSANPSSVSAASINLPQGVAPTSPNNGDCWTTTAGLYCQINGVTVGPHADTANANTWSAAQTFNGKGYFFAQNGAIIHRLNDRLFIGGATANDGAYPNVSKDWLSTLETGWGNAIGYPVGAIVNVLTNSNASSGYAILGGAQTLQFTSAGGAAIGTQGHCVNNNTTLATSCWGGYFEAHRVTTVSGSAHGIEVDAVAHVAGLAPTPLQQGILNGVQLGCGGGYSSTISDCDTAIQVVANGASFKSGINVLAGAITAGHQFLQLPTGTPAFGYYVTSGPHAGADAGTVTATFVNGTTNNLNFTDNGLQVSATDNTPVVYFSPALANANYSFYSGATSGNAPGITAAGSDTAVGFTIAAKGTGTINLTNARLIPTIFSTLPACNTAGKGTLAFITDAGTAITAWHQTVSAGGGSNPAFIACNGSVWAAFDY